MERKCLKWAFFAYFLLIFDSAIFAQNSNFTKGEDYFKKNQPNEAIPLLEAAISAGENPKAYTYLSLAYYQVGNNAKALEICSQGMKVSGTNKKILSYNAGNIAFADEDFSQAETWYSTAISADSTYSSAVLNRANARLKLGKYEESKTDYRRYLTLEPETSQYEQIQVILAMLDEEIEIANQEKKLQELENERLRQEEERIQQEQVRLQAEKQRLADEQARQEAERKAAEERAAAARAAEESARAAAAAERRRKLLEDVASSLQDSTTQNMSAGAEGTVDYGYESELE